MPKTSPVLLLAATAFVATCILPTSAWSQDNDCLASLDKHYAKASPDLSVMLDRLEDEQRTTVLGWADCSLDHKNLARLVEEAVRALDVDEQADDKKRDLFVSAAQNLTVTEPDPRFARSALIGRIRKVEPALRLLEPSLRADAGKEGWMTLLADLNAETHALSAWVNLDKEGLVGEGAAAARDELSAAMLMVAAFIAEAKDNRVQTFDALANNPASIDALGQLWQRAETALSRADAAKLGRDDDKILDAVYEHKEAIAALFTKAKRPGPRMNRDEVRGPSKEIPKADVEPDAGTEDPAANNTTDAGGKPEPDNADAEAKPNPDTAAADAGAAKPDPFAAAADAGGDKGDAGTANADAGTDTAGGNKPVEAESELYQQVRLGILGTGLLLPWIWLGILALLRRRKSPSFAPLGNRSLAVATLLLVFEAMGVGLAIMVAGSSLSLGLDALYLAMPPYWFAVLLIMLGKIDKDEQLSSRKIIRNWARWGTIGVGVLLVANIVVALFVPGVALFAAPISIGLVGVLASVFLIRLWRSGNTPGQPAADGDGSDRDGDNAEPAEQPAGKGPDKPPTKPSAKPKAKAKPKPKPEPKPAAEPKKHAEPESKAAKMSDEELAAAFAAMEGGDSGGTDDVPDDRAELYKLLGDD